MNMLKAYKYRIYPTAEQQRFLAKSFGCARWFYNYALNKKIEAYKANKTNLSAFTLKKDVAILNKLPDTVWLAEPPQAIYTCCMESMAAAYNHFFKEKSGFPKFRKKHGRQSITLLKQFFNIDNGLLKLPKIQPMEVVVSRMFSGDARRVTVSKTPTGKYFVSVLVEEEVKVLPKTGKTVGIYIGLKDFATTSENIHISNPRYLRENQAKLERLQMWLSKKRGSRKGETKSRRWLKLHGRINALHERVANRRNDFLHKLSTSLVRDYDVICLEDLNVKGMMQNHNLAGSIGDASWSTFNNMLEYKSRWYGKELKRIGRFDASSKTCSHCGHKLDDLKFSDRMFACPVCGLNIDRDYNAAVNIKQMAVGNSHFNRTLSLAVTKSYEASMLTNKN